VQLWMREDGLRVDRLLLAQSASFTPTRSGPAATPIVLEPGPSGDIASTQTGVPGLTGFGNPVDLVEDRATGNLYVAEIGAQRITLVRPLGG